MTGFNEILSTVTGILGPKKEVEVETPDATPLLNNLLVFVGVVIFIILVLWLIAKYNKK